MAKRKLSPLVQAMNLFVTLDERDRATMADFVKSQTATPRKKPVKKEKESPSFLEIAGDPKSKAS